MARTYAAVEIDEDARPKGWKLMRSPSPSVELIRKLRQRGFFANHGSLRELEQECVRLSKFSDPEAPSIFMDAGLRPYLGFKVPLDTKNCQTEQAVQSPPTKIIQEGDDVSSNPEQHNAKALSRPCSPCMGWLKDSLVDNWYMSTENGETVPIMEVPFTGSELSCVSTTKRIILSGFTSKKEQDQLCIAIEEWKFNLRAEGRLAIHVKTTKQVWAQLGKPQKHYEQTIRSVLVYMQLFSMVVTDSEITKPFLLQHLTSKFHDWKVKPDVSDLHESLILMKKLNLGCLFPIEKRVLSRVTIEAGDIGESDADNGATPLTFKRSKRHITAESQTGDFSSENAFKGGVLNRSYASSSGSEEESLTSKRQTRPRKGIGAKSDLEQCELLSPNRSDSDHVLLSSKLHALKKRKANPQTREDSLMSDRILKRDRKRENESIEGCIAGNLEVDSVIMERASTSADDEDLEISDNPDEAGEKLELDNTKSRISKILRDSLNDAQHGHKWQKGHMYMSEPLPAIRKLWDSTFAARQALDFLDKGGTVEEAQKICSKGLLANVFENEVSLREFGVSQFLPAVTKQKEVAERVNYYAHDGDTVVEICCQKVDYLSLLKEKLTYLGKLCDYKRFMINQSQSQDIKEWMNLEGLPTGSKLLVCLSLSFALWGEQSNKILDYALELKPKLIVLIAPLFSRRLDEHTSYNLIWEDAELLQNEVLWPWGLMEVPSTDLEKRKGVSPIVFLWSRTDWTTKHRQIASRFGHLKRSVPSSFKG